MDSKKKLTTILAILSVVSAQPSKVSAKFSSGPAGEGLC